MEDFKFDIKFDTIEVGETYPIYGMITEIVSENPVIIIINNNIRGTCEITDPKYINLLRERSLEPAIFITEIEEFDETEKMYSGHIKTIVFGKKQEMTEQ